MTYENTPHPEIDAALTLEDAAKKAGYTVNGFRTTMSKLNKAGNDLRAPARPGERARRYDADKLAAWIEGGKIVPDNRANTSSDTPTTHATATYGTSGWTATLESGDTAVGKTLRALQTNANALASRQSGQSGQRVHVELDVQAPGEAGQKWADAAKKFEEARKLESESNEERRTLIAELHGSGFTQDDIAAMFGITQQRVNFYLRANTKS